MPCTHDDFFDDSSIVKKCELAKIACEDDFDMINFFAFTYCQLNGNWGIYIPISIITILLVFRFISLAIEDYLAPAIQFICQYYSIPDSLCAVTLIALVNGKLNNINKKK